MGKTNDITGNKYNRLTALGFSHVSSGAYYWIFSCECGEKTICQRSSVQVGSTKSCGCLRRELSKNSRHTVTHGMSSTRFYNTWKHILRRCNNRNTKEFASYGNRGIKCLWKNFEDFKDDMYESYLVHVQVSGEKNTSIDRIDNDGNYSKYNCRWATHKEQARNTRTNHRIEYKGQTKTLVEWSEILGMKYGTLNSRLGQLNWSVEKSFEKPVKKMYYG